MSTMAMSTQLFRLLTTRSADDVWRVLTEGAFYGAAMESDWEVGSSVELGSRLGGSVVGEVLASEQGVRLTHTLGDRPDQPSVYITWTLHPDPGGTIVRLYVDEVDVADDEAVERAWLPVLRSLQSRLDRLPTTR